MSRRTHIAHAALLEMALVAFVGGVAGCGGPAEADLSRFLGIWTVKEGTRTITCSNQEPETLPFAGAVVFTKGSTTDLRNPGPPCQLDYNVAGNTASAISGQTCNDPRIIAPLLISGDAFTTSDGVFGTRHASGTLSTFYDLVQGMTVSCTWFLDATYQRSDP